ncbi:Uncharacterised protein [Mycobacterium tuberculosis]|uniref:Uncharacterized protein n=1 Tax=Mycobacterium tuberculosis TaxID=1773 RepID=A0A654U5P7_MYCTX|nr:Uncharacterised protein [Mycobacterium tuberculosis]CNU17703.1 Uncharacterised protein [Mycobacterium tuberculosis]COX94220.1 Uncharacterised protein [Mycobacterium tuberculosis]
MGELEPGDTGHRAVATRAQRRILRFRGRRISENLCQRGEIEEVAVRQGVQFVQGGIDLPRGRWFRVGVVIAHDQFPGGVVAAEQLVELQPQLTTISAEFDHVVVDHQPDSPDQLEALHHRHHIAQRDEVLDFCPGQLPADLVEPGFVPLQGCDGLVGPRQDGCRVGQYVTFPADVDGHDVHRVAH